MDNGITVPGWRLKGPISGNRFPKAGSDNPISEAVQEVSYDFPFVLPDDAAAVAKRYCGRRTEYSV